VTRPTETRSLPAGFRFDTAVDGLFLLVNDGPSDTAVGHFGGTGLTEDALWSRQVLTDGRLRAVIVVHPVTGTGPERFQSVHATAERTAERLGVGAVEVAVSWAQAVDTRQALRLTVDGWAVAGYGSGGAGGLVLVVTDAVVAAAVLDTVLTRVWPTFQGETVLVLASGASGRTPARDELALTLSALRQDLACPKGGAA
jgi:glutamate N-acetyltransferase/amino-acid N-acetyltransferase